MSLPLLHETYKICGLSKYRRKDGMKMPRPLRYSFKGRKSVLSQLNYSTCPRYISARMATKGTNTSVLGITKYNDSFGVDKNDTKRFPGQNK